MQSNTSPIVTCPGCDVEMTVDLVEPSKAAERIDEVTYKCPQCGTRTTRLYASTERQGRVSRHAALSNCSEKSDEKQVGCTK
ncbi:MAG: hypothetical protein JWN71_2824 [Xanthobacteraceae bacterium]|nr:hypothetical protein [Xanthobacteraceae bacterium]